jgi:hypothetical protein
VPTASVTPACRISGQRLPPAWSAGNISAILTDHPPLFRYAERDPAGVNVWSTVPPGTGPPRHPTATHDRRDAHRRCAIHRGVLLDGIINDDQHTIHAPTTAPHFSR